MVESTLRAIAVVTSLLVIASFALFARDEVAGASRAQQAEINDSADPGLPDGTHHKQPRRFIDGAARVLLRPFSFAAPSGGEWGARGVPTALALLLYGFGLGFLARAAQGLP